MAPRSSEHQRVELLRALFGDSAAGVPLGIGDDCAVLDPVDGPLVWSVDAAVEGVHFRRDLMSLEAAGYRATMAALSDLAAMGARPLGVLSALVLPRELDDAELLELARGQATAARELGTSVVGGNLARGDAIAITTTVLGAAPRPMRRDRARVGDAIWLCGPLGLAAAGLELARRGEASAAAGRALDAFRRPRAQIDAGLEAARAGAACAIDVSDGLAADLAHVARASRVSVVLEEAALRPLAPVDEAASIGRDALDLVLAGGEDYALVVCAPPDAALPSFRPIGRCEEPKDGPVWLQSASGDLRAVVVQGFDHFG